MTPDGKRIFGYGRASTDRQEESPLVQKLAVTNYALRANLGAIDVWLYDPDTSGGSPMLSRSAGRDLLARVRPGDVVVVAKVDRAFRSLGDLCNTFETLKKIGAKFHAADMGFVDFNNPWAEAMFQMLGVFAQLERRMISVRTKDALRQIALRGERIGGTAPPPGYRWEKRLNERGNMKDVLLRDNDERELMKRLLRMHQDGMGFEELARTLNEDGTKSRRYKKWNMSNVYRMVRCEMQLQAAEMGLRVKED